MHAVVYNGPYDLAVEEVDDPRIEAANDAVIKIQCQYLWLRPAPLRRRAEMDAGTSIC